MKMVETSSRKLYATHAKQIARVELFLKMADAHGTIWIDEPNYYTPHYRYMLITSYLNKDDCVRQRTVCYKSIDNLEAGVIRFVERGG